MMVTKMLTMMAMATVAALPAEMHKDPEWDAFKAKYKKHYKDSDDEAARYSLFRVSKARVAELNKLNGHPAFGINWMSDRYPTEQYKKGLVKPKDFVPTAPVRDYTEGMRSPKGINWRHTEVVTPIKNQGQCGSCWAFSATEAIESQMVLTSGGKGTAAPPHACAHTCSAERLGLLLLCTSSLTCVRGASRSQWRLRSRPSRLRAARHRPASTAASVATAASPRGRTSTSSRRPVWPTLSTSLTSSHSPLRRRRWLARRPR